MKKIKFPKVPFFERCLSVYQIICKRAEVIGVEAFSFSPEELSSMLYCSLRYAKKVCKNLAFAGLLERSFKFDSRYVLPVFYKDTLAYFFNSPDEHFARAKRRAEL